MCRKLCFLVSFVLVFSLAGSAIAATVYNYQWTNASGDGLWNRDTPPYNWQRSPSWQSPPVWTASPLPETLTSGNTSGQIWLTGNPTTRLMPVTIPAGYDADCGSKADTYQTIFGPEWGLKLDIYGKLSFRWTMAPVQSQAGLIDANDPNDLLPPDDPNRSVINMYDGSEISGPFDGRCESLCIGLSWWFALPYVTFNMYGNSKVYSNSLHLGGHLNMYGGTMDILTYALVGTRDTYTVPDNLIRLNIEQGKLILPADITDAVQDWINRGILKAYGMTPGLSGGPQIVIDTTTTPGRTIVTAIPEKPPEASNPNPANAAADIRIDPILSWTTGRYAAKHDIYFSKNFNDVNNANTSMTGIYKVRQVDPNYTPGTLEFNTAYNWRVDEVNDVHPDKLWRGAVWSFTTGKFLIVDDFESYNDTDNTIYSTWVDYAVNNTGMTVGHLEPPFAEQTIVHNGLQSIYIHYDNDGTVNEGTGFEKTGTKYYSEAEREWAEPQDWTRRDVNSLTLWLRGIPASVGSFKQTGQNYTMTAAGEDIFGTADQFHFAYKQLSGAGEIIAKVQSVSPTHAWAKAGVMIRETKDPDSKHVMVVVTPGNGVSMQHRLNSGGGSEVDNTISSVTAPQWVRLTRTGNTFTAEYSASGSGWTKLGSIDMAMAADTYIGLCLTSHNTAATCTAEFSNVTMPASATGQWENEDIGITSNIAEQLYVVLQDSAGNSSPMVKHSDPAATTVAVYTPWNIPLTSFAGVNLRAIRRMTIGVGNRNNPKLGGAGDLYIDDIRLMLPAQ